MKIRRYPDNCYAVVIRGRRGACAPDTRRALERWLKSGLIKSARTDKRRK